ncbi:hypothetical protein AVEN_213251-1 [Araneus ventricosus]|uniref:Speckle-type POZ protein n=1 Tax=Araneus ventricosus TaxID=182803 RepID=A0A4Y2DE04_ARAVE|nr:hypothetical protein AVEN_213251-1 [Araneus ventricosus]
MAQRKEEVLKFIWKVENFSYCWNETDDFLESPRFCSEVLDGSAWCLKLYPKGRSQYENYVSVYLERLPSCGVPSGITIDYEIALLRPDGSTECVKEMKDRCFREENKYGFDKLVARERLFGEEKLTLLPADVLTLQCCIFPKNTGLETYTEVIAKTQVEIQRYRRQWKNIDYTRDDSISINGDHNLGDMWFELSVSREDNNQLGALTGQFGHERDLRALHCKIGVLDSNNSVVKVLVNNFVDIESASEDYLSFPLITVPELLENQSLYLPNGKLNLDCEFTVCDGTEHGRIEGIAQDATLMPVPADEAVSSSQIDVSPKKFLYCIDKVPSSLRNDFQNLYQEGTLCDFTVKVGDKHFKVHKAVLCARSPAFNAMLTSNMRMKKTWWIFQIWRIPSPFMLNIHVAWTWLDILIGHMMSMFCDKYGLITLRLHCSEVYIRI